MRKGASCVVLLVCSLLASCSWADAAQAPWRELWKVKATGRYYSSPALGDLDGDGCLEIVSSCAGPERRLNAFRADGSLLWSFFAAGELTSSPAVGDLDGDGGLEVLQADRSGYVYCLRGDGALRWVRPVAGGVEWGSVALAALSDGRRIAVVGSRSKGIFAFAPDGRLLWRFDTKGTIGAPSAAADFDGDGNDEIFQSADGHLFSLDVKGHVRWAVRLQGQPDSAPAVADLNGDGDLEVVSGDAEKNLRCLRASDGGELWRFPARAPIDCAITVANVDDDPYAEIIFGDTGGGLYCLDHQGRRVWDVDAGGPVFSEPVYLPVPGPQAWQVTYLTRSGDLHAVTPAGERVWSMRVGIDAPSSPALGDLDADGKAELVVGTYDGYLICFKSDLPYRNGESPWPMRRRGGIETAFAGTPAELLVPMGARVASTPIVRAAAAIDWSSVPEAMPMGEVALALAVPGLERRREVLTVTSVRMSSGVRSTSVRLARVGEPEPAKIVVDEGGPMLVEAQVLEREGARVLAADRRRLTVEPFAVEIAEGLRLLAALAESRDQIAGLSAETARALSEWVAGLIGRSAGVVADAQRFRTDLRAFNRLPFAQRHRLIETAGGLIGSLEREAQRAQFAVGYLQTAEHKDLPMALGSESGLIKIFKDDPTLQFPLVPGGEAIEVYAARGEYDNAQLVVMPLWRDLSGIQVQIEADLKGPNDSAIAKSNVAVNPVGYIECRQPPYPVTRTGWWPDPLMASGPTDCRAGELQPFWITVYVPPEAAPGDYRGVLEVTTQGGARAQAPLRLHVWDFALPERPALETAFGVGYYRDWFAEPPPAEQMRRQYLDFLLKHRLSTYSMDNSDLDFVLERGATAINVGPDNQALYQEMKRRGLLAVAYSYIIDEPPKERFPEVQQVYSDVEQKIPGVRRLCTVAPQNKELHGYVDLWVPILNDYQEKAAKERQRLREQVWWYVCLFPYPDYPNYYIDYQPIRQRILAWMNWKYSVTGILYWSTTYGWTTNPPQDGKRWPEIPWNSYSYMDFNGDGSLIYPGPQGEPLSSIRLEAIRDGVDDYDYFALLKSLVEEAKQRGRVDKRLLSQAEVLLAIPSSIVRDREHYTYDPGVLLSYRRQMGEAISQLWRLLRPQQ